jgi:hypothetical protein
MAGSLSEKEYFCYIFQRIWEKETWKREQAILLSNSMVVMHLFLIGVKVCSAVRDGMTHFEGV